MTEMTDAPLAVIIEKSGIRDLMTLPSRPAAEELRRWLREQRCRVGPVFEPSDKTGGSSFFVHSRRVVRELVMKNARFTLMVVGK